MPLRITTIRAALHTHHVTSSATECSTRSADWQRVLFSTTSIRRDDIDDKNHYETLNIRTNASPSDIKKSFYSLSKTHHPDHNRQDPHASRRFMRISEAYNVLSHTESRTKYDRDVLRLHQGSSSAAATSRSGSYSSTTGPAGGRPASGLSRRRGTFRGPPPSFYRSGGWGAHSAKRSAAHEESTGSGGRATGASSSSSSAAEGGGGGAGGMGPGQGYGNTEIPHFDRAAQAAHMSRQARIFKRRAASGTDKRSSLFPSEFGADISQFGGFFAVLAVLGGAIALQYMVAAMWSSKGNKETKRRTD